MYFSAQKKGRKSEFETIVHSRVTVKFKTNKAKVTYPTPFYGPYSYDVFSKFRLYIGRDLIQIIFNSYRPPRYVSVTNFIAISQKFGRASYAEKSKMNIRTDKLI